MTWKIFENLFQCKIIVVPMNYTLDTIEFGFNDSLLEILNTPYWKVYILDNDTFNVSLFEKEKYDAVYMYDLLNINGNQVKFTNNKTIFNMLESLTRNYSNTFEKDNIIKFKLAFNLIC